MYFLSFDRPQSKTYRRPSMVGEVSATFIASTTSLLPPGGSAMTLSCSLKSRHWELPLHAQLTNFRQLPGTAIDSNVHGDIRQECERKFLNSIALLLLLPAKERLPTYSQGLGGLSSHQSRSQHNCSGLHSWVLAWRVYTRILSTIRFVELNLKEFGAVIHKSLASFPKTRSRAITVKSFSICVAAFTTVSQ